MWIIKKKNNGLTGKMIYCSKFAILNDCVDSFCKLGAINHFHALVSVYERRIVFGVLSHKMPAAFSELFFAQQFIPCDAADDRCREDAYFGLRQHGVRCEGKGRDKDRHRETDRG